MSDLCPWCQQTMVAVEAPPPRELLLTDDVLKNDQEYQRLQAECARLGGRLQKLRGSRSTDHRRQQAMALDACAAAEQARDRRRMELLVDLGLREG